MKRFFEAVMAMKTAACYSYCGSLCVLMAAAWLLGWEEVPLRILTSLLLVCAVAGILQVLAFTELVVKRLAYGWRMVLFAVPFFTVLTAVALLFRWFPAEQKGAWLTFAVIFLAIFLLMSVGFEIYFRVAGKKYDGLLGQYRKQRENR